MVEGRLSKLQKTILTYLYKDYKEGKRVHGGGCNYRILRYIISGGNEETSFRSKFSRSIRNLEKKQLIDVRYCHQIQKTEYRQIKKCKGRKPEDNNPCENCFYVKKYKHRLSHLGSHIQFIANNKYCGFFVIRGYCGRNVPKKRIREITITDRGVAAILKDPEMMRDTKKKARWRIAQMEQTDFPDVEILDYEDNAEKKLKKNAKGMIDNG